jgi:type IV/VI secretion system ImpK/VasF family protein
MAVEQKLEKLCEPLLLTICNYWQLACMGTPPEMDTFRKTLTSLLEETKQRAAPDEKLAKEFSIIEKPLVFFIDYIVKEGRFPFKNDWYILARSYNELSGDEKFFDLLEETLNHPDTKNSVALFFVMLGLGFDGIHRKNQAYIQHCMRSCIQKAAEPFDVFSDRLSPEIQKRKSVFSRRRRPDIRFAMIVSVLFMLICFAINLGSFMKNTSGYRFIVSKTVQDAIPKSRDKYPPFPRTADTAATGEPEVSPDDTIKTGRAE